MAVINARIYIPTREWADVGLDGQYKILPNFRIVEIANNKAKENTKLVLDERAWKLLNMLQLTRNRYGAMHINSLYRTKSYNASVGGSKNSAHLRAWAFDWQKTGQTDAERKDVAGWWRSLCKSYGEIGAINYYTNGYHCEIGSDILFGSAEFTIRDYRGKKGDW